MDKTSKNIKTHKTGSIIGRIFINHFNNELVKTLRPLQVEKVLDVECGEGFILNLLQKEKIGKEFVGIDNSDDALEIGKKLYPRPEFKKGDIYKLPFKDNSFDLVICAEVLEHLENPKKAYKELIRVSRRYILISVPNEPFFTIQRWTKILNIRHVKTNSLHLQHWTIPAFTKFVKVKGVKLVSRKFPIPWTVVLLHKV